MFTRLLKKTLKKFENELNCVFFFFQYKEPLKSQMIPMKCFTFLFLMQTSSKNLTPVPKPASICGMDLVNGKITSGCHILKVGNNRPFSKMAAENSGTSE